MDILKNLVVQYNENTKKLKNELEIMDVYADYHKFDDGNQILKVNLEKTDLSFTSLFQFIELIQKINKFTLNKVDDYYILSIDKF
jgi:hypothetical protein